MQAHCIVGIDLGTTSLKAALVAPDATIARLARRPMPTHVAGSTVVHAVDDVLDAVRQVVREAVGERGGEVVAIGIASAAEVGLALEGSHRPLTPLIGWRDRRAVGATERLREAIGPEALWATTGLRLDPKHPLAKWAWFGAHEPAVLERMRVWAGIADLVAAELTGEVATVASLACRTAAWDLGGGRWADALLAHVGMRVDQLPTVRAAGEPVGDLRTDVAAAIGLRTGIPVVIAGHDHLVGAYAVGGRGTGVLVDSAGTAEAIALVTDRLPDPAAAMAAGVTAGRHADGRSYCVIAGLPGAGDVPAWVGELVGGPGLSAEERRAVVDRLVGDGTGPPTGLVVEPYLDGRAAPAPDPDRPLAVHGADRSTTPDVFARAVLEGVAHHARWMADALVALDAAGDPSRAPESVIAFGGGVRQPAWTPLRAALYPWPLRRCAEPDAVVVGAAALAAPAAGLEVPVLPSDPVPVPPHADAHRRHHRESFLPIVTARRDLTAGVVPADEDEDEATASPKDQT